MRSAMSTPSCVRPSTTMRAPLADLRRRCPSRTPRRTARVDDRAVDLEAREALEVGDEAFELDRGVRRDAGQAR
jgi:hypothetical protein